LSKEEELSSLNFYTAISLPDEGPITVWYVRAESIPKARELTRELIMATQDEILDNYKVLVGKRDVKVCGETVSW